MIKQWANNNTDMNDSVRNDLQSFHDSIDITPRANNHHLLPDEDIVLH